MTPEEEAKKLAAKAKRDERKLFLKKEREKWRVENEARNAEFNAQSRIRAEQESAERLERLQPKVLRIVNRGLIDVLAWQAHHRGRNWVAFVEVEPSLPGGIKRTFFPRAAGKVAKVVIPERLAVGDVLEFGGDYVSYGARRSPNRVYAVVLAISATEMIVKPYEEIVEAQLHVQVRIA